MAREIDNDRVKKVEVYGTLWHKVTIEPRRVINEMIKTALKGNEWVESEKQEDGTNKYFLYYEDHKIDCKADEITEEEYIYIRHLQEVRKYLDKHYD